MARMTCNALFLSGALVLSGCGSSAATSIQTKTTQTISTTSAIPSTTTTTAPKAQAASERPLSISALSAKNYWVVTGNSACATPSCLSILHTTDGGVHFSKVPVPNFTPGGWSYSIDFVNAQDGYFVRASAGAGSYYHQNWYTTNGGSTWNQTKAPLITITGGGYVYGLVPFTNEPGAYSTYTLKRARIGTDSWTTLRTIDASSLGSPSMATYKSSLWISTNSQENPNGSMLFYSSDYGNHFTKLVNPCSIMSGCQLYASSPTNIWATYSPLPKSPTFPPGPLTIMRSTDSGANWSLVAKAPTHSQNHKVHELPLVFWTGRSVDIITKSRGQRQILRTDNGVAKTSKGIEFPVPAGAVYFFIIRRLLPRRLATQLCWTTPIRSGNSGALPMVASSGARFHGTEIHGSYL